MYSLRKWLYKPKKTDTSLLANFYHSDEELYLVASELDSFDARRDPERCAMLVNEMRFWQDSVLNTIEKVMDDAIPSQRTSRDFRVKFPDDVLHESLAGQLWFGAECLAAGSIIMNREVESASMRPLARALTKNLDSLRATLRDQCLRSLTCYTDKVKEALVIFDKLLAEFELSYVSSMVPVKTMKEYDLMQEVIVLFSETLSRTLHMKLLTQDQVDVYEPAVMFTIPRLAIVCGLLVYPEGPLNPDNNPHNMSEMFRPFQTLLYKIRELLYTLTGEELYRLEKLLCSQDTSLSLTEDYLSFSEYTQQQQLNKQGNKLSHAAANNLNRSPETPNSLLCNSHGNTSNHIIVHSPDSGGSPVTPVNDDDRIAYLPSGVSKSSSVATIVKIPSVDLDEASVSDTSLEEDESYIPSDIAAIAEVIDPKMVDSEREREIDTSKFKMLHKDSDSGLDSGSVSLIEGTGAVTDRTDSACGVSVYSEDVSGELSPKCDENCTENCENCDVFITCDRSNGEDLIVVDSELDCLSAKDGENCDNIDVEYATNDSKSNESDTACSTVENICDTSGQIGLKCNKLNDELDSIDNEMPSTSNATILNQHVVTDTCNLDNTSFIHNIESEPTVLSDIDRTGDKTNHTDTDRERSTQIMSQKTADPNNDSAACKLTMQYDHFRATKNTENPPVSRGTKSGTKSRCSKHKHENAPCSLSNPVIPSDVKTCKKDSHIRDGSSNCPKCCKCPENCGTPKDPDTHSIGSSDTSSYNSDTHDDEEIALAIHAAEMASRNEVRSRFQNSSDLIHRLFVCVSGVADQLQTNYASDLRNILKCVFDMSCTDPPPSPIEEPITKPPASVAAAPIARSNSSSGETNRRSSSLRDTPTWLPDVASTSCMGCHTPFTLVRRRHHCRNCGKLFCSRCSSNTVPLPHIGHPRPVRVCIRCYICHVTPFTVSDS